MCKDEKCHSDQNMDVSVDNGSTKIVYHIWQISLGVTLYTLVLLISNIASSQEYKIVANLYTLIIRELAISLALAAAVLILGCIDYHNPWVQNASELNYKGFRYAYEKMKTARIGILVEIVLSIFLFMLPQYVLRLPGYSTYLITYDLMFAFCLLVNGFALSQCTFQISWIGTSRRTPSVGIAVANVILYFTIVLDVVCCSTSNIDIIIFSEMKGTELREHLNNVFNSIPDGVKTGVVLATGIALLKDFISQFFASITNLHPANLTQQRRHIRHRLLTHWNYKASVATFSRENFRTEFLTVNFVIGAFFVFVMICRNAWDVVPNSDNPPDGIVSLAIYALIFMLFSFTSLWSIRDETLIQSEHMYLSIKSVKLTNVSIRDTKPIWRDYCQVLCNLATNVSGIDSEDDGYQNISHMLSATAKQIANNDACILAKFCCDILRTKGNMRATLLRDSSHEKNENDAFFPARDTPLQIARDLQFATLVTHLLEECYKENRVDEKNIYASTPLSFVLRILEQFFRKMTLDFSSITDVYCISNKDIVNLLKVDILQYLFRYETAQNTCGLFWLRCNCSKQCQNDENHGEAVHKYKREILILTLPFIIVNCFDERWKNAVTPMIDLLLLNAIFYYYYDFFDTDLICFKPDQLKEIVVTSLQQLADMQADLSLIKRIDDTLDMLPPSGVQISSTQNSKDSIADVQNSANPAKDSGKNKYEKKYRMRGDNVNDQCGKDEQEQSITGNDITEDLGVRETMLRMRFSGLPRDIALKYGLVNNNDPNSCWDDWDKLYAGWKRIVYMCFVDPGIKKN